MKFKTFHFNSVLVNRIILLFVAGVFVLKTSFSQPDTSYFDTVSSTIYQVLEFKTVGSQTYLLPCHIDELEVLVVAGGGGGGTSRSFNTAGSGGGGAGGVVYRGSYIPKSNPLTITVGAGGTAPSSGNNSGGNGGNSRFGDLVAIGGGGGIGGNGRGRDGGSGGGSRGSTGGAALQSSSASGGFGNQGGNSGGSPGGAAATGGGGAGAAAGNLSGSNGEAASAGGEGMMFEITGTQVYYAGGGGGGASGNNVFGTGGTGGGGNGANNNTPSTSGVDGLGGGGGGGNNDRSGSNGGSGIVIIRYEIEAGNTVWTGAVNQDWHNAGNWGSSVVPANNISAVIPSGLSNYPEVGGDYKVSQLIVESGAEIMVKNSGTLTVQCPITNSGIITIENNGALIQRGSADNNTGSGTYKIERDGKAANNAFNAWSSPVPGLPVHDNGVFSDANPCDIFVFDASKQNWSHDFAPNYSTTCNGNSVTFTSNFLISGADGILSTARGYFVPGASGITRTFEGSSVHNGDISKPLESGTNPGTPNINWTQDNWNLIGNPYPSAIDISSFLTENASGLTTASVYIWDDGGSGNYDSADFIAHNLIGATSTGGGSNSITNGNIASAQGFFVQGTGAVNFTNAMRASGNDEFRSGNNLGQNRFPKVWLSVDNSSHYNEILVALHPEATTGFDKLYDAPKYYGQQNLNISANLPTGEEMVISAEAPLGLNEERIMPLTLQTANNNETKFKINRSELIPENVHIFLIDSLNDSQTELTNGGVYTPQLDSAGKYTNRFYLLFKNNMIAADDDFSDSGNNDVTGVDENYTRETVKVWSRQNDVVIETKGVTLKSASLIDASGRLITTQRAEKQNRMLLNTSGLSSGIYMVRTVDQNGKLRVNKVVLAR